MSFVFQMTASQLSKQMGKLKQFFLFLEPDYRLQSRDLLWCLCS